MENLIPKINIELSELRKLAKKLNCKVTTKTLNFDGDVRRHWSLYRPIDKKTFSPSNVISQAFYAENKEVFELINNVTKR